MRHFVATEPPHTHEDLAFKPLDAVLLLGSPLPPVRLPAGHIPGRCSHADLLADDSSRSVHLDERLWRRPRGRPACNVYDVLHRRPPDRHAWPRHHVHRLHLRGQRQPFRGHDQRQGRGSRQPAHPVLEPVRPRRQRRRLFQRHRRDAFQLAVWEIVYDATPAGNGMTFDLASGKFRVCAAANKMPPKRGRGRFMV